MDNIFQKIFTLFIIILVILITSAIVVQFGLLNPDTLVYKAMVTIAYTPYVSIPAGILMLLLILLIKKSKS